LLNDIPLLCALAGKGFALHQLGNNDQAIAYYDKALAIDPSNADTLTNKALALAALHKYGESIKYSDMALAIEPNLQDAINARRLSLEALRINRQ
jgi:tetratricopeptide (TPR) repeat protein